MTPNEAPATTSPYKLAEPAGRHDVGVTGGLRRLAPFAKPEARFIGLAAGAILASSVAGLMGPLIISWTIDDHVRVGNYGGVLRNAALLLGVYLIGLAFMYVQTRTLGGVGRRVLYAIRHNLFAKLQELPLDFFNQNKAGDLISRVNNDTDKVNTFFTQGLGQLVSNLFMMAGTAVFLMALNPRLGAVALAPAVVVFALTRVLSPWVKRQNARSLQSLGGMSAEIQESLSNFKVVVAFGRRDFFREKFNQANEHNFRAATRSGMASGLFIPIYGLAHHVAQVAVLGYGVTLIARGEATVGLLVGYLLYVNNFYLPMRQFALVWATFQLALAGLDRISAVLAMQSNLRVVDTSGGTPAHVDGASGGPPGDDPGGTAPPVLAFDRVWFAYPGGSDVLRDVSLTLERGKTYALVGPTGGGKTTTASLMARLYDPVRGTVRLDGRDVRSYQPAERAAKIGFITQEPFLFTGTIRENLAYGNDRYATAAPDAFDRVLDAKGLSGVLSRFADGLDTKVTAGSDSISLGEKQVIAFARAVLREPEVIVLDEATANIDTGTEQVLQQILDSLPPSTTRIVVAHRLNTIANADEIYFVNAGTVTPAGSMAHAVEMLLHGKRAS